MVDSTDFEAFDTTGEELVLVIEVSDFKDFVSEGGEAGLPEGFELIGGIEDRAFFCGLEEVEGGGFFNDGEGGGSDFTDTGDLEEIGSGGIEDAFKVTEAGDEGFGGLLDVAAGDAEGKEEFEGLIVAEALEAGFQETGTKARAVAGGIWDRFFH